MGEVRDVQWSWESRDGDTRVGHASVNGRVSVTDLVSYVQGITPGVGPDEIMVNFATVRWTRPATADELAERQQRNEDQRVRQEKWERETLQRLLGKYGNPGSEGSGS